LKEGTTKEGSWEIMKLYDEESLIDINKIGPEVLKTIFGSYPEYYLCLLDWLDEDDIPKQGINIDPQWGGYHGAEKDDPFYEDKEYSPRNKDMHSLYELFLIKGAGDDNGPFPSKESTALKEQKINYFAQIINPVAYAHSGTHQVPIVAPPPLIPWPPGTIPDPNSGENPIRDPSPTGTGFTVYGDGKVNINTAGDTVLGASGFTPATIIRLLTYRFRGNVFKQTGANYIIQQLVNTKCLLTNEQAYSQITSNITNVVSKGKIKVNSDYFRAYIKSETTRGTENTVIMVLKRERVTNPKPETKIKIIAWWENFYLP